MNHDYIIVIDGSADLEEELIKKYDIRVIPMNCSLNGTLIPWQIKDHQEAKTFYDAQRKGDLTKTTLINPFDYQEFFKPLLEEGKDVLYLCLSTGLSSTYSSCLTAIDMLKTDFPERKVIAVDTRSATGHIGLMALRAALHREQGMSIEENEKDLLEDRDKIITEFMVRDLQYLKRGGRISSATAFVGGLLNIVPVLHVVEDCSGTLGTLNKCRGHKKAIEYLLSRFEERYHGGAIYVMDSDEPELSQQVIERIQKAHPEIEIHHTLLSPVIGAHTGPGMLGLVYHVK